MAEPIRAIRELPWITWLTAVFHLPCLFHLLTGLYCPGCGGTRAVKYLLTGHPVLSLCYHPLVLYGAAVLAGEVVIAALARKTGPRKWHMRHQNALVYIGVVILIVNWVFKNYMLAVKGIDLLPVRL